MTEKINSDKADVDLISLPYLENKFIHVKVGNDHFPANPDDISEIASKLNDIVERNNIKCVCWVTHHNVELVVY